MESNDLEVALWQYLTKVTWGQNEDEDDNEGEVFVSDIKNEFSYVPYSDITTILNQWATSGIVISQDDIRVMIDLQKLEDNPPA